MKPRLLAQVVSVAMGSGRFSISFYNFAFIRNCAWLAGFVLLVGPPAFGYSEFISYGYSSCITCHFNGQGGGPLNDYGRALFTTEIAARGPFAKNETEEESAAKSGFLGKKELPWWIRPGVKYRGLYMISNPGSESAVRRYVTMQADASAAILFDQAAKWMFVGSIGYQPTPAAKQGKKDGDDKNLISREHYVRWQATKKIYAYFGLLDKVYGIRIPDHTAFSRSVSGVAQSDQAHSAVGQYYGDGWEATGDIFLGNLLQESSDVRQVGFSAMYERDLAEKNRVGVSLLQSKNDYLEKTRLEMHSKVGLLKGNSLLTEIGAVRDNPKIAPNSVFGGYLMLQGVFLVQRGYNLLSQVEYYNSTMTAKTPDMTRWTFGMLMYPMPRMELRTTFVNGRSIQDTSVARDQWMLQTQMHLSL